MGIDAGFTVHFAPDPFFVDATGSVGIVCIPLASAHFYADSTGLVDVSAGVNLDIGPLYFQANVHGRLQMPRWQIDFRGEGGIRHLLSAEVKGLIGNLGLAGCARVEVFPETPLNDAVYLSGGAGIRFSGGIPPLAFPQLIANMRIFLGCDLRGWSPFGRSLRAASDGGRTFTVDSDDPVLALQLTGAGGAPKVTLRGPDGKTYDASKLSTEFAANPEVSGLLDEDNDRSIVFLRGQKGNWTVTPTEGSPALSDVQFSTVLPEPKVSAKVGGAGAKRLLRYRVTKLPGQVVTFVEQSAKGMRTIKTVKGGGNGTVKFLTSEGGGTKRTVTAQVVEDGVPRANVVVARFSAPSPRGGKVPRLRIRRSGSKATATWGKAAFARSYQVVVETGDGRRLSLTPAKRTVTVGGLSKGEGARVSVTSRAPSGRLGATVTKRLRGDLTYSGFHNKKRPKVGHHKKKKRKRS